MAQLFSRRFQLADLMIVVVAVAAATAWTRIYVTQYLPVVLRIPQAELTDLSKVGYLRGIVVPSLVAGSVAILVMALRPPRPPLRRLARRPGPVACGVVTFVFACRLASVNVGPALWPWFRHPSQMSTAYSEWVNLANSFIPETGLAIVSVWVVMRCGGSWRGEPHWIDRWGRVAGYCWICCLAYFLVVIRALG